MDPDAGMHRSGRRQGGALIRTASNRPRCSRGGPGPAKLGGDRSIAAERTPQFDLYYVQNMSPFVDLAIVINTFKVLVLGRGAR
jgi:lipopolysaccharide/colanic/teichoic acid biosynthesis glycosyltransferase